MFACFANVASVTFTWNLKLAQHAYEEGHRVGWDKARVLATERNRYRECKDSAHMACLTNPISQPTLAISPI
jgi:hypothetical protein